MSQLTIGPGNSAFQSYIDSLDSIFTTPTVNGEPVIDYLEGATGTTTLSELTQTQAIAETQGTPNNFYLVLRGSNLVNGTYLNAAGTLTSAVMYSGGTYSSGAIHGGLQLADITFSSTEYQFTAGNATLTLRGSGFPTTAQPISQVLEGDYSGGDITLSQIQETENGQSLTVAMTATTLTITVGPYEIIAYGSFPNVLTASQLDSLISQGDYTTTGSTTGGITGDLFSGDVTSATAIQISTGATIESLSGLGAGVSIDSLDFPASSPVVSSGDTVTVLAGGFTSDTIVDSGGVEQVNAGATETGAEVANGGEIIVSGGALRGASVKSGGEVVVSGGGTITGLSVAAGATVEYLGSNGFSASVTATSSGLISSASNLEISSGGTVVADIGLASGSAKFDLLSGGAFTMVSAAPVKSLSGDGVSDLLLENASGAIAVGEVTNGQLGYTTVAQVGSAWEIDGTGDFLGLNSADVLFYNSSSGALVIGNPVGDHLDYTQIGAVGPEWQYGGSGNFVSGWPAAEFLLHNDNTGALVVAGSTGGPATYTPVGGFGDEWSFEGTGDLLGDGNAGFLLHDTHTGALVVGEVTSGSASYTQIGGIGNEWQFEGTGNFLGNGHDDFLLWNSNSGALVVGDVTSGSANYTTVGGFGPEWHFLGTGDYQGTGTAGFMVENISGAIVLGTIVNGHASYAQVGAVGSEWSGKTGSPTA